MGRFKYLIVIAGLFFYSCGGSGSETADNDYPTYEELETINYELEVEIGERDGYIPGNIQNIIVTEDGSMIVADAGNVQLDQYDSEGTYLRTIATEGNGPGEVPSGFSVADMGRGKYIVRAGGIRYYLTRQESGEFIFGESFLSLPAPGDRRRLLYFARNDSEYYARAMPLYMPDDPELIRHVAITNQFGEMIEDSLQVMVTQRVQVDLGDFETYLNLPNSAFDELVNPGTDDGRYIVTRPLENALDIYNSEHDLEKRVVLNVDMGSYSDVEVDSLIAQSIPSAPGLSLSASSKSAIRGKMMEYGKPPFITVWATDDKFLTFVEDGVVTGQNVNKMAVYDLDGVALGKFTFPTMDRVIYFRDNKIYAIREDPARGYFVRVYSLGI